MKQITLEVGNDTAQKWQHATVEVKQEIAQKFELFLKTVLNKREDELWPFLEKIRQEAEAKGFNDDILAQILNEK